MPGDAGPIQVRRCYSPIAGQLLVSHGLPYRGIFVLAVLQSLCSSALFCMLAMLLPARTAQAHAPITSCHGKRCAEPPPPS